MFSILQKPQETVNAEDLEILQNQIEKRLVEVVAQRWELERELDVVNNIKSPDSASNQQLFNELNSTNTSKNATLQAATHNNNSNSNQSGTGLPSGKLRNSLRVSQIEPNEITSDGFKGSHFISSNTSNNATNNNGTNGGSASGTNSNETDSISSESSLISEMTGSTIITTTLPELGSQITQTTNSSNNKRGLKNSSNDRPSKRFRQENSNSLRLSGSYPKRPPHSKHRPKVVPSKYRNSLEESRPNKKQVLKNEAPDKLWPFIEQFCAIPTEDQMKELEEMMKSIENDKEYFKVPSVGKNDVASKRESPSKNDTSATSNKNQKKNSKLKTEDGASLGALTQRLVSSLIDETDDSIDMSRLSGDSSSPPAKKKKSRGNKNVDPNNAKNFEKRIRQELEGYSILTQQDDIPYTSEEDETLRELLACQHELQSIQNQNKHHMQVLLKRAKRHAELEREREKLKEANSDVISAYVKLIQAKQRKRNPTKKEKDAAWKALKVHEAIFKRCDEIYMSSLDRNINGV